MAHSRVQCVAIISQRNAPLYLRNNPEYPSVDAKWYFLAHSALDMLDERLSQSTSPYLGLLLSVEDTAIYGFQTSTQLKILLMLEQSTHDVPDKDISDMFRAIHAVYMSYMSNPFVNMGADDLPPNASMDTPRRPTVPPFASGKDMPVQNGLFDKRISAITGWTVRTTSDV